MKTFWRLAKKAIRIEQPAQGNVFKFDVGDSVLTSEPRQSDGKVVVLSNYWVPLDPDEYFCGEAVPAYHAETAPPTINPPGVRPVTRRLLE